MLFDLPAILLWEDGVFETLRSHRRQLVAMDEHLDRLFESSRSLQLSLGLSREEIRLRLRRELASKPYPDAYVRMAFLREGKGSRFFLIVKEAKRHPSSFYERGVSVRTAPTRRNALLALDGQMKVKEFMNGILSTLDGLFLEGPFEEIYLDSEGYVTEGKISNIFFVKGGSLFTPPPFLGVLRGITRGQVIEKAHERRIAVQEEPFTRFNLYGADEIFLTNTSMGVMPVVSIDGRMVGRGKVGEFTRKMIQTLKAEKGREGA
ncbi:MAG: aminotransferase class IV [Candidatus Omnitrophica bacterium]|nr:aminotransferase class IV [Candidatus Omnitrophota bacterium]